MVGTGQHQKFEEHRQELRREIDNEFMSCPRYEKHELSAEQIEQIAESAAIKAVQIARDNFYKDVGKAVISRWLIAIGIFTVATYAWFRNKGIL